MPDRRGLTGNQAPPVPPGASMANSSISGPPSSNPHLTAPLEANLPSASNQTGDASSMNGPPSQQSINTQSTSSNLRLEEDTGNAESMSSSISGQPSTIPDLLGITRADLDAYVGIQRIIDRVSARRQRRENGLSSIGQRRENGLSSMGRTSIKTPTSTVTSGGSNIAPSRPPLNEGPSVRPKQPIKTQPPLPSSGPTSLHGAVGGAVSGAGGGAQKSAPERHQPIRMEERTDELAKDTFITKSSNSADTQATERRIDIKMQQRKYELLINRGKTDGALEKFKTDLENSSQRSDTVALLEVGHRLAKLLMRDEHFYSASQVAQQCIEALERIGVESNSERTIEWQLHDELAVSHMKLDRTDLEAKHYRIAVDILSQLPSQPERYPHIMNNLGNCYKKLGAYNEARSMLERSKELMSRVHGADSLRHYPEDYQKIQLNELKSGSHTCRRSSFESYEGLCRSQEAGFVQLSAIFQRLARLIYKLLRQYGNQSLKQVLASLADLYKSMELNDLATAEYEQLKKGIEEGSGPTSVVQTVRLVDVKKSLAELYLLKGEMEKAERMEPREENLTDSLLSQDAQGQVRSMVGGGRQGSQIARAMAHAQNVSKAQSAQKNGNQHEAARYYEQAIQDIEAAGDAIDELVNKNHVLSLIHNNLGNCYQSMGHYRNAQEHLEMALAIRIGSFGEESVNDDLASTRFNLGNLSLRMAKPAEAIIHYNDAIRIYEKLAADGNHKFVKWLARSYRSLAQVHQKSGHGGGSQAVQAYEKALDLIKRYNCCSTEELQAVLNNLGNAYQSVEQFEKGCSTLKESLEVVNEMLQEQPTNVGLLNDKASCLNNLGAIIKRAGHYNDAIPYLKECIELRVELVQKYRSTRAKEDLSGSLQMIADIWKGRGVSEERKDFFQRIVQTYEASDTMDQQTRLAMSICYENIGDETKAMQILDGYGDN